MLGSVCLYANIPKGAAGMHAGTHCCVLPATLYLYEVHSQLRSGGVVVWPMRVLVVQGQCQCWDTLRQIHAMETPGRVSFQLWQVPSKRGLLQVDAALPCRPPRVLHPGCLSTGHGGRNCRLG
jgi:hypothetical protein